jgi:uncharacterized protein YjiK
MARNLLLPVALGCLQLSNAAAQSPEAVKIRHSVSYSMEIHEPSDLAFDRASQTFYVVSDDEGCIAQIDSTGQLIRKSQQLGYDMEALTQRGEQWFWMDEMTRTLGIATPEFEAVKRMPLSYFGGRNKAFESLVWIDDEEVLLAITERDPIWVLTFNSALEVVNQIELPFKVRDISGATWHNGKVWLLSDEDRTVFECSYPSFKVERAFVIPVINPEGLAFDSAGKLYVCSDDLERLFVFSAKHFTP